MKQYRDIEIQVAEAIEPKELSKRRVPSLEVDGRYYVSFEPRKVVPVTLVSHQAEAKMVTVSIKKYVKGKDFDSQLHLYEDEIGDTPTHAIENALY